MNELLFASSLPFADEHVRTLDSSTASTLSDLPIHELIRESLTAVSDADIRKELCGKNSIDNAYVYLNTANVSVKVNTL